MSVTEYKILRAILWRMPDPLGMDLRYSKRHQKAVAKLEMARIICVNRDVMSCVIIELSKAA